MERFANFDQFATFLQQNNIPHKLDRDLGLVELVVNAPPLPNFIYVKWDKNFPIVTFVQMMIQNVPPARIQDLEAAASRLNTLMEIGGFCYDYEQNRVFSRFTVPLFDGISATAFQRTFELVVKNARGFLPLFQKVVDGAPGIEIERLAREHAAELQRQAQPVKLPD